MHITVPISTKLGSSALLASGMGATNALKAITQLSKKLAKQEQEAQLRMESDLTEAINSLESLIAEPPSVCEEPVILPSFGTFKMDSVDQLYHYFG